MHDSAAACSQRRRAAKESERERDVIIWELPAQTPSHLIKLLLLLLLREATAKGPRAKQLIALKSKNFILLFLSSDGFIFLK
jgi:hypothetical protein